METFHRQIFNVHCCYTVLTMVGMILFCVLYNTEIVNAERGSLAWAGCLFMALFWGSRVCVQIVYYDKAIKKKYPVFNVIFLVAFNECNRMELYKLFSSGCAIDYVCGKKPLP